mgnify:CR=1 FL=1
MKRYISIFLIILMILSLAACYSPKKSPDVVENQNGENKVVEPSPKTDEKEVTLYFANKKYVETGDEKQEKLIAEKRVIKYGDTSIEEAIVRELMKGTENNELYTEIPSSAKLINVEVSDGTAFVNFAQEGMFGGSLQESFTISQIVESLTELSSINRVQFLIDGKKAETLMGHFDISKPFEK